MAIEHIGLQEMLRQARPAGTDAGSGNGTGKGMDPRVDAARRQAFALEMRMAASLFKDAEPGMDGEDPDAGFAMDGSAMGDAMMLDALRTIARLTGEGAGLNKSAARRAAGAVADGLDGEGGEAVRRILGGLSARFESGRDGVDAIGYDRVGGTSYGTHQIASRTGTMDRFLDYLDEAAPEYAERLRAAGPADTGSTDGAMPEAWKAIAAEAPERFARLQQRFIRKEHFDPALEQLRDATGVDLTGSSEALKEVLFSTAVQHGPTGAARIFGRAVEAAVGGEDFEQDLIREVYDMRKTQFGSSTERVRKSVISRLEREEQLALNMLTGSSMHRVV